MFEQIRWMFGFDKKVGRLETSLSRLESKVNKVRLEAVALSVKTEDKAATTERAATRLQQETTKLLSSLNEHRITIARLEETLDAAREELRTAKLITIPGLVEANQTMLARWEAETAIHVARASLVRKEE